ncbi:FAD-dependent monooxygenase [Lentibacter algarum]|uniref:FAD-dependent monooxygenase n=1 Tax=Lentibacter algarum TaxID=576131 RepID=UPI001C08E540|nr:FAD-dependent monooxygenase [Lentibacter algarum]MBU2982793.1 FAD-dependent monooxygenase [Lentibacter algarum]
MLETLNITIIGAGIGGLAAAQVLATRGAKVTVLEQASEVSEVGAGLQVSPNGLAVLRAMGLEQPLVSSGAVLAEKIWLKDYQGAGVLPLDLAKTPEQKYYFLHRSDLINVLLDGAREAGVEVLLSQQVKAVQNGGRPTATLAGGATHEADLIIGADGVHSVVRGALNGPQEPFFTGHVAWRAVVPNSFGRLNDVQVHMGPKRHLVSYPLRGGKELNLVAVQERDQWLSESWSQQDDPANLRAAFDDFGEDARAMLAEVQAVHQWGLFRHDVAARWQDQGLALLGDAAHSTLPFLAQGAVMALEDAWVLGQSLEGAGSLEQGLQAYQSQRITRTKRVVKAATGNAWKYHLSFLPMRFAAHTALRLGGRVAPSLMLKQFDWLYGHDVTQS